MPTDLLTRVSLSRDDHGGRERVTEADYSDGVGGSVRRAVMTVQKVIGVSRLRIVRFCGKSSGLDLGVYGYGWCVSFKSKRIVEGRGQC